MWKLSYKHVKAISFPPQSPRGQRGLCYEICGIMLWRQATLCWRFCGRVGVLKKQMNPEMNVKETCGIPQQITQLQVALLLQTCQMGSDAVSLEESLFISFKQVIFITERRNTVRHVWVVWVERWWEDFSSTFPLVQAAHNSGFTLWILLYHSHRWDQWLLNSSCFCFLIDVINVTPFYSVSLHYTLFFFSLCVFIYLWSLKTCYIKK